MGRHKKGWVPPQTEVDPGLKAIVASLPQGEGKEYCWRVRAVRPGQLGAPYYGPTIPLSDQPADGIPELVKQIRADNPDFGEITVCLHDAVNTNIQVLDEKGHPIKSRHAAPDRPLATAAARAGNVDPEIEDKKKALERDKQALDLRRERLRFEQEQKRIDDIEAGIVAPERGHGRGGPVDGEPDPRWPFGPGVPYKVVPVGDGRFMPVRLDEEEMLEDGPVGGGMRGRFGGGFRDRMRGHGREDGLEGEQRGPSDFIRLMIANMDSQTKQAQAGAAAQAQIMTAMMQAMMQRQPDRPPDNTVMQILPMLMTAMTSNQLKPETILGLYGPMMAEMSKMSNMSMKSTLEMHQAYTERMLDQLEENGRDPDEVDKFRKYADLIKDSLQGGVQLVTGRASILQPGKSVPIPLPAMAKQPQLQAPKRPALAPPATATAPVVPPTPAAPPDPAAGAKQKAAEARVEAERRVRQFFEFAEVQMHASGDPAPFLGDPETSPSSKNFWDAFDLLPLAVRGAIGAGDVQKIYAAARLYAAEVIDRIEAAFADPLTGQEARAWMESFWTSVAEAETEEEEEEAPGNVGAEDSVVKRREAE